MWVNKTVFLRIYLHMYVTCTHRYSPHIHRCQSCIMIKMSGFRIWNLFVSIFSSFRDMSFQNWVDNQKWPGVCLGRDNQDVNNNVIFTTHIIMVFQWFSCVCQLYIYSHFIYFIVILINVIIYDAYKYVQWPGSLKNLEIIPKLPEMGWLFIQFHIIFK